MMVFILDCLHFSQNDYEVWTGNVSIYPIRYYSVFGIIQQHIQLRNDNILCMFIYTPLILGPNTFNYRYNRKNHMDTIFDNLVKRMLKYV